MRHLTDSLVVILEVSRQACSTLRLERVTSAKFGLHADNMKFSAQNKG
jgi:hypothetical protein